MFLLFNIKEFLGTSIGGMFRGMLAGTYDMMLKLNELFSYDNQLVMQVSTSIYVVGIFVLFRVLVAMLNYLIDPEKVSDKQVGAGKLLVRIVVSFALLLTLQSFIFPFLKRFEDSILDSGIIDKIFEKNQTLNLDDNNLLVNVSADVNESNIGISCTDSYKGAETYAWLAWNVAGKFGTFEDYYGNGTGSQWVDNAYNNQYMGPQFKVFAEAYDGCSLTNFINRFKEFMTVESDGKYQWQDNPSACGGKEACFSVGIPDACNDTKCLMDTESNIVSGMSEFNFDSKFYLCKNGDKKDCENVIFNSDAVDENTGEHLEVEEKFECDYIYRDTNSNLANCSHTPYV